MKATYTKLKDGTWGIRTHGGYPANGANIAVTKKDGTKKHEIVSAVLWKGTDSEGIKVSLCKIAPAQKAAASSSGYSGSYCGGECPVTLRRCNAKNGPCHDCL